MKLRKRNSWSLVAVALAVGATALTACSSSPSSTASSSSGAASSSDPASSSLAAVAAYVKAHSTAPTSIGPTQKIGKPIPTGKTIDFINCGAQSCINVGAALQEAVDVLGWKMVTINAGPTPQAIQAAFEQAVKNKPDGVYSGGFGISSYERQLAQLKAANIPVISSNGPDQPTGGLVLQIQDPKWDEAAAKLMADKMIVDQGGKGELGLVTLTGYPTQSSLTQAVRDEITSACPACTTKTLELAPTAIGTTAASQIANFLRANPKIQEIYLSYDDLANGLKAAIANAGGTYPKTVSWAPTQNGIAALQNGQRTAAVSEYQPEKAWQVADAFARIFTGQSPEPDYTFAPFFLWSQDYNNVPTSTNNPAAIVDYQAQFKALWGK